MIHVVRLGTPRASNEGPRLGTVRRPPRGVPKDQFAARDYYDVWLPNLAPSLALMQEAKAAGFQDDNGKAWNAFARRYRAEMSAPEAAHVIATLVALSHTSHFAVGCYCEVEARCHRSLLRALLKENGAAVADGPT